MGSQRVRHDWVTELTDWLMLKLKLKLQYFVHVMWRTDSLEKTLMLGKIEGKIGDNRGWDGWMASSTQWTWVWVNSGSWWWTGKPGMLQSMELQRVRYNWATELNMLNVIIKTVIGRKFIFFNCAIVLVWNLGNSLYMMYFLCKSDTLLYSEITLSTI